MKKILIILSCLFFLVGCSNDPADNSNKEKISSEISYISSRIANLFNNLNNISLENYELVSEKISISQNSSSSNPSGEESQPSSGQQDSQSSSGGGDSQSTSQSGKEQNVSVTEMKNNSVLNIDTEDVDWDIMRQQVQNINTSWGIVMLDLYNSNVSNTDIIEFSNLLDATIISIKNEDKSATLTNLTTLYSYIPKFLTAISSEKHVQNIETTKYHIFAAYSAASQNDWNAVTTSLSSAETSFLSVLNDTEYSKNKEFKINKTYILIKDMQNSVSNNDKELFLLKYKNLIESLNTL